MEHTLTITVDIDPSGWNEEYGTDLTPAQVLERLAADIDMLVQDYAQGRDWMKVL